MSVADHAINYGRIDADILRTMQPPGRAYFASLVLILGGLALGAYAFSVQWRLGLGVAGYEHPMLWGIYITNFVFWVGIAHSGTLISAVLFLFRAKWRTSVARASEAMTVFAVMTAGLFPIIHIGRPWFFYWLIPYPNERQLWVNFQSPLVWDVFAITTYLTVSAMFLFLGLIPDVAAARDRCTDWRKPIYRALAIGWRGSTRQWIHYGALYGFFAALATPLVVSVHSVVSWDFAMSILPGWHSTIFAPYFVAGAIFSGLAMVITLLIPLRKLLGNRGVHHHPALREPGQADHRHVAHRRLRLPDRVLRRLVQRQPVRAGNVLQPDVRRVPPLLLGHAHLQRRHSAAALLQARADEPGRPVRHLDLRQHRDVAGALRHHRHVAVARLRPGQLDRALRADLGGRRHHRRQLLALLPAVPASSSRTSRPCRSRR